MEVELPTVTVKLIVEIGFDILASVGKARQVE